MGRILRACGQIPVQRQSAKSADALLAAVEAVDQGRAVVIYPEGTITRDPDLWPMAGKTGAARIALRTGCPVVPIGQWGAQELMYGRQIHFPKLLPRKTLRLLVGDPVDLDDLRDQPVSAATLAEATDRIMDAITALVAELRQEPPPAERFVPPPAPPERSAVTEPSRTAPAGHGDGLRVVGDGVRPGAGRRRTTRSPCGPAGRSSPQRSTPSTATRTTSRPSTCRRRCARVSDPAAAMDGAEFVVLAVPSQSLRRNLDRLVAAGDGRRGQPGQGHRAGHRAADERGDRRRRRRSRRSGSRSSPGPTWPGRSPSGSPRPAWWPVSPRPRPRPCSRPATRRGSGPTPTPTWSAASWAARPRT